MITALLLLSGIGKKVMYESFALAGAHYTYSYHLYYLVFQSLGPPLREERRAMWTFWFAGGVQGGTQWPGVGSVLKPTQIFPVSSHS